MLEALISHFPFTEPGAIGSIDYSKKDREKLAKTSRNFSCSVCGSILEVAKTHMDFKEVENKPEETKEKNEQPKPQTEEKKIKKVELTSSNSTETTKILENYQRSVVLRKSSSVSDVPVQQIVTCRKPSMVSQHTIPQRMKSLIDDGEEGAENQVIYESSF